MRHLTGRSVMHALTVGARGWWRRGEKIFEGIFLPEKTFSLFAMASFPPCLTADAKAEEIFGISGRRVYL